MKFIKNKPVTLSDLYIFFRQFSTLIAANISILKACEIIENSQDKLPLKIVLKSIKNDILAGKNLFYCFLKLV